MAKEPWKFYNKNRPDTEIMLFDWQTQYLKTRDQKIWLKMFQVIHDYARSMVLKRMKGKAFLEPDLVEDKATSATLTFMNQYLNNPNFVIGGSFAGMLKWKVIEAMAKDYNEENHRSLDEFLSGEGNATLEDNQERANFTNVIIDYGSYGSPELQIEQKEQQTVIEQVLSETENVLDLDIKKTLLVYFYLIICLRKPKNRHAKKMFIQQWADFKTNRVIDDVILELRNRLKELKS